MKESDLRQRAYAPYSKNDDEWCVVRGSSGVLYPGVRVENISFPLTITSLHGALCSCLANGDTPTAFYSSVRDGELVDYLVEIFGLERLKIFPERGEWYNPLIDLSIDRQAALRELTGRAVVPHSDFPVSALLQTEHGFIPGVNVELHAWALGLCAERLAIFRAVSHGYQSFSRIQVYAPKGDFSSPCGACRQVMMEWMPDCVVELRHGDESLSTHKVRHLLPHAFSSSKLIK